MQGNFTLKANADALNISMVAGYPFYFILGYLLKEKEITKKHKHIIYFLGGVGFVSTILLDLVVSLKIQKGYRASDILYYIQQVT